MEDSIKNNIENNIGNNSSENNTESNIENDISEVIINLLADYGYTGIDALTQLTNIYEIIQDRSIKDWIINDETKFLTLKDSVWYTFEYLLQNNNPTGKTTLKTLGSKFPIFAALFTESSICSRFLLNSLLVEVNEIMRLWNNNNIYLANIVSEIYNGNDSEAIIYMIDESPIKYSKDTMDRTLNILDLSGNNIKLDAKQYVYVAVQGKLNDFEQSKIYYAILEDLRNTINIAIQYHKDMRLVIR